MKRDLRHVGPSSVSAHGIKVEKAPARRPIEALESRLLLSGNVNASLSDGNLIIQGNAAANVIFLDQPGLNVRNVRITGDSTTTINHQTGPVILHGMTGDVNINMGAGADSVTLTGLTLPGKVLVSGLGTVNVDLQSMVVQGKTKIVGGTGRDVITIDDSTFKGAVRLSTGGAKDLVQIETQGDPLGRPTRFRGPVSIRLGDGNDTLQVGVTGETGHRALFPNAVFFDGGSGVNTLLKSGNNTFLLPWQVQIVNFQNNPLAQAPINLGTAGTYAVMATASITSKGISTHINGDVGLRPGTSQGIPPAQVNGTIRVGGIKVKVAQADLLAAYNDAASRSVNSQSLPGNLGGLTFTPGLYTNSSSVLIEGSGPLNNVTLDAQGDPNAIFIFQMGSTLTTGSGAQVILAGGAKAGNIFWQVGSSATLGTTTIFKGNILAAVSITVKNGSAVRGRLLAASTTDGSVTINASTVTVPVA